MKRKVKPFLQVTQTECGLSAARCILAWHGCELRLAEMRQKIEPGRDGLSLKEIAKVLEIFGLRTRMYRVKDFRGLMTIEEPFIAYWKGYHFVVVESINDATVSLMDPMIGRTTITREQFEEHFTDFILTADKGEDFRTVSLPVLWEWRGKPIWPTRSGKYYIGLIATSLALFGVSLALPWLTQQLIDSRAPDEFNLRSILMVVAVIAATFWVFQFIRSTLTVTLVKRASWALMNSTFTHLMRLPLRYFTTRPPGELLYRLSSLNGVRDLIANRVSQGALDLLTALILLAYVFYVSPPLATVVSGLCLIIVALLTLSRRLSNAVMDAEVNYAGRSQAMQLDGIVSVSSIRMGTYVDTFLGEWRNSYRETLSAMGRRLLIQQSYVGSAVAAVQMFGPLLVMAVGLYWVQNGQITLGETVASQTVTALILSMSTSVYSVITESLIASKYLERVDDIFSVEQEPTGGDRKQLAGSSIAVSDVDFAYTPHASPTLMGINLHIEEGETVALVGESGSGKTTLGKLICSLYEPTGGEILYGGVPGPEYHRDSLRSQIGYIPQEVNLHNKTILENLIIGIELPPEEAIERCLEFEFLDFVKELPMGYNTLVSEMGANFSAGQRQRVAIAKALLREPKILVLDEATSALDNVSQRFVHETIAARNCTQIIIAHRLSTVRHANRTFVMRQGEIVESGRHSELLERAGYYSDLYDADRVAS